MHIALLTHRDTHGTDTLDALERRASRHLGRIAHLISDLVVSLVDLNGPKGGIDRQCQVQAKLHDGRMVVVKARSESFGPAIDNALHKLLRRLIKQRKRVVEQRRTAQPFGRLAAAVS
ncbi:MAG: HPF/RaiA family ribosome-associated protein [Silanimonas sp.]